MATYRQDTKPFLRQQLDTKLDISLIFVHRIELSGQNEMQTWCTYLKQYCGVGRYFVRVTSDTKSVLWLTHEYGDFPSLHG